MSEDRYMQLGSVADLVTDRISTETLNAANYISTENMLPDRGGITAANNIPDQRVTSFRVEDTLFSNIRTYFRKVWLSDREGGASPDIIVFRSKDKNVCDSKFLHYLISSKRFIDYTTLTSKGAKMPRGDKDAIKLFEFPSISIDTQRSVAHILSSLDDKIALNRKLNATLEAMAQALFKSWFVDFDPVKAKLAAVRCGRDPEQAAMAAIACKLVVPPGKPKAETLDAQLPSAEAIDAAIAALDELSEAQRQSLKEKAAHFPADFQESELGLIPLGWAVRSLDKIANYQNGLALQKFRPAEGEDPLPIVKIAQLKTGEPSWDELASPSIKSQCILENGDVVFSWSGSLVVTLWSGGKAALNQHLFKVTSKIFPKWFYLYWTKKHLADFQRIAADKAVTMGHIKRSHLADAHCAIPSDDLVEEGTKKLSPMIDVLIRNELESRTLGDLRDALLPKLLSGEISVSPN